MLVSERRLICIGLRRDAKIHTAWGKSWALVYSSIWSFLYILVSSIKFNFKYYHLCKAVVRIKRIRFYKVPSTIFWHVTDDVYIWNNHISFDHQLLFIILKVQAVSSIGPLEEPHRLASTQTLCLLFPKLQDASVFGDFNDSSLSLLLYHLPHGLTAQSVFQASYSSLNSDP